MQDFPRGQRLPRIAILAEAGPLAGDLAACLSGRYAVERVTSTREAQGALLRGCRALLLTGSATELAKGVASLAQQAHDCDCRLLLLGSPGLRAELEADLLDGIRFLPAWPSPQEVLAALAGLDDQHLAGA